MTLTLNDIISERTRIQSPYVYLQAAGSEGDDGTVAGIHLRWDFLRSLGDTHLPKGNLASPKGPFRASGGFNKSNDFVTILRAEYNSSYPVVVDFRSMHPSQVFESGSTRYWRFNLNTGGSTPEDSVTVVIRFTDAAKYETVRAAHDPTTNTVSFIAAYDGVLEAEVLSNTCFATSLIIQQTNAITPGSLRLETVSVEENIAGSPLYISSRKSFDVVGEQLSPSQSKPIAEQVVELDQDALLINEKMYAENIRYVRIDYADCFPVVIRLETYRHFLQKKIKSGGLVSVGSDFALSVDEAVVHNRLEDTGRIVDQQWPRYYGADTNTGLFTASTANYQDKWSNAALEEEGLKELVVQYLDMSKSPDNPSGTRVFRPKRPTGIEYELDTDSDYEVEPPSIPSELPEGTIDEGATVIDSLSMIRLIATDFHAARMLGLGHIDNGITDNATSYIYIAVYETNGALELGEAAAPALHISMTLPTTRKDSRLPVNTVLKPLTFGLKSLRGSTRSVTDAEGYLPNAPVRMINLHIETPTLGRSFEAFFADANDFTTHDITLPVCFGIKYKLTSESDWQVPELSHDEGYQDASGVDETIPLIAEFPDRTEQKESKLFVHAEDEEGTHRYAVYGINWFSRASALSNTEETTTTFSVVPTVLPPSNFTSQLIQKESPLVFTTAEEQSMLQAIIDSEPEGDHTLIRVEFDWNHSQNIVYQWANKAELFFRQDPLRIVRGEIKSVTNYSDDVVEVRTKPFITYSKSVTQTYNGKVVAGDELRFKGSLFSTEKDQYTVEQVIQSIIPGEGSIFRLKKKYEGSAHDVDNANAYIVTDEVIIPSTGERFLVTENLTEAYNWTDEEPDAEVEEPLTKNITIVKFSEHQEQITEHDGKITTLHMGGIYDTATVTELEDIDGEGDPIPGSHTGMYEVAFDDVTLSPHPDQDVVWYKGVVRISLASSALQKKVLNVINITTHGGSLLKVLMVDPDGPGALDAIQTGASVYVNFHPGYRVYLRTEIDKLTEQHILPLAGDRVKQTLLGIRASDTIAEAMSPISIPSILLAREIVLPVAPLPLTGGAFATRPDFYGKSTYTFDTPVNTSGGRRPYALVFYRANEQAVLSTLYKKATLENILNDLENLSEEDAAFNLNRFIDLVEVNLGEDGKFKTYITNGYQFPNPDNDLYVVPDPDLSSTPTKPFTESPNPETVVDELHTAIESTFLSLTESPVLYVSIKTGRQTSGRKPVIRNSNGEVLAPTDPAYDPAPMAVILPSSNTVRFTDYTIDGTSSNIYFYYVKELNDLFQFGDRSPMLGPVRLINSLPPEAPGIKRVITQVEDQLTDVTTGVVISCNTYLASENIKRLQLYRATSKENAASVRSMKLVATTEISEEGFSISDVFNDLTTPPYGETLYYRVVALREIINEQNVIEYIHSLSSDLVIASVIDVNNPVAPDISATIGLDSGQEYQNVKLSWSTTTYNGKYYLYKMTSSGNWQRIFETASNVGTLEYTLPGNLSKIDGDGQRLYYRFKVDVENSSGLMNLQEKAVVI